MAFQAKRMTRGKPESELATSLSRAIRGMEARLDAFADSLLHGDRLSGLPGRGLEAAGVREYQAGDEARGIDWRVTARKGRLHVRIFDEERDLPSLVVVHRSASFCAGREGIRETRGLEAGGLLAALSLKSGDRTGLLQGGSGDRAFLSPARTRDQLLLVLERLLSPPRQFRQDSLSDLLLKVRRLARERTRIFLISDFQLLEGEEVEVVRLLAQVGERHLLHPVRILDRAEGVFPGGRSPPLRDPRHTGESRTPGKESGSLRDGLNRDEDVVARLFRDAGLREWKIDVNHPLVPRLRGLITRERKGG